MSGCGADVGAGRVGIGRRAGGRGRPGGGASSGMM